MKNTFGQNVAVTLFGESHGEAVGAVVDGLAAGIAVDEAFIRRKLEMRRPYGEIGTKRVEKDDFHIISGVFDGKTTGTPICIIIPNENKDSVAYDEIKNIARPGHADYTNYIKSHGCSDYRGGGHSSGRITAALAAAGAIAERALENKGIFIGTHIKKLGGVSDREFSELQKDIATLNKKTFAALDEEAEEKMKNEILFAKSEGDSVGGVLETAVIGLPAGVGEPWFDGVEGILSHALFGIPGIKGIEFGAGFEKVCSRGSEFNDAFEIKDGKIITTTNNSGGILGGITNGMPIIFRLAVKPTPSIEKEQKTVDFVNMKNTKISVGGRHDPAIIHRVRVVVDSMTALALCDILAGKFGSDYLA